MQPSATHSLLPWTPSRYGAGARLGCSWKHTNRRRFLHCAKGEHLVAQTLHKLRLQLANTGFHGAELAEEAELVDVALSRLLHQRWLTEASLAATDAVYSALSCDGDNAAAARAALHQLSGGRVRTWWMRLLPLVVTSSIE